MPERRSLAWPLENSRRFLARVRPRRKSKGAYVSGRDALPEDPSDGVLGQGGGRRERALRRIRSNGFVGCQIPSAERMKFVISISYLY